MAKEVDSPSISPAESRGRLLLVDDDASMCEMLEFDLSQRGFQVEWCTSGEEALPKALAPDAYDVVITDLNLKGLSGIELCKRLVPEQPDLPVIVITAFGSIELAVSAIRAGAYDFITKPFEFDALALTVERAVQHHALKSELVRLRREVAHAPSRFEALLGKSPPMTELFRLLERVADSSATAMVLGESGVGKELVARALHDHGKRKRGPFVALNCGAVPETLLESELFGHVKGAFTDARTDRAGVFREANGGTLFLDEVGELPVALQPKLLRALQERTVRPVGGGKEIPFDVRIVAATNRDLEEAIEKGQFREDLYYRLNVVQLNVPPLRSRGTDLLLLAQAFLERIAAREGKPALTLSPEAAAQMVAYEWPGNVRELQNSIERAVAISGHPTLRVEDLPERLQNRSRTPTPDVTEPATLLPLDEVERRYILQVMEQLQGNKRRAAQVLGLDRSTLYRKLQQFGVAVETEPKKA